MTKKLTSKEKQSEWLNQHLPHRLRAGLVGTALLTNLAGTRVSKAAGKELHQRCFHNAAWEGRLASVRWLIEFIGVQWDSRQNKPKVPLRSGPFDVWIEDLDGGVRFDILSPEAVELAKIWKGCSQATAHPTDSSNHPDVSQPQLERAMEIIHRHLDATVFKAAGSELARHL